MRTYPYNRALNLKTYAFAYLNMPDVLLMGVIMVLGFILFYSFFAGVLMCILFNVYLAFTRIGKPMGYDRHFVKSKITARYFRAGQIRERRAWWQIQDQPKKKSKNA